MPNKWSWSLVLEGSAKITQQKSKCCNDAIEVNHNDKNVQYIFLGKEILSFRGKF